jgi:hypothetical protein
VAVAAGVVAFSADDQGHLAVGLQAHQSVDDLHPGLFEGPGPGDIGPLVEPGLQFDDSRHLFAGMRRSDQGGHERAIGAGAVQGLLDGKHVRVDSGPLHEGLDRGGEGLIGVMKQYIALGEHDEQGPVTGQLWRDQRRPGFGGQVRSVDSRKAPQSTQVDGSVGQEDGRLMDVDRAYQQVE